ncbi:sensor histidine kinase [Haloterrigena alkaliphila]|uniref:histidine kinase n=1 Tax=Haloterrigena alkaliphila TaxID=2816475 RepID=A0A8A2VEN2_9EURY|nr:ATP-binding protein [Haloterrigena alkaliphila]QSW99137.1 ATP-binding protein [Haloterrigena alkaliphila]
MSGSPNESPQDDLSYWYRVILAVGVLLLMFAIGRSVTTVTSSGSLLEAGIDLILLSVPGLVMLYTGLWLPTSSIKSRFYPRIVAWTVGGVVVMGIVLGLRVLHPGVDVNFTFGTQAVLLSIGSIAGLGIGVNNAQALTHAQTLEERNETLRRTERQLEEAVDQLRDSNEQLEQFAYAASHDLQEPLRMVTRYLELAESRYGDEFDEDFQEFIDFAVDGAERMSDMIDGLLEYSRVETQGDSFEDVDLDAVLDDVLADLQFKIEETDATITRESLPTIEGDGRQLQQLFQNLLSNAIDYSGEDPPRIHVSAAQDGEEWTVSVRDEGVGIDVEDSDRIFDIFQRLHSIEEHTGSGIGLALCKRIVERHGGEIWVDSDPGEGSTFSFTLSSRVESSSVPSVVTQQGSSNSLTSTTQHEVVDRFASQTTDTD